MKTIDILLQGEGIDDVQLLSLPEGADLAALLKAANSCRIEPTAEAELLVFIQDEDKPVKDGKLPRAKGGQPLCVHVHRCRKIAVSVTYNGVTKPAEFSPARTVGAVKTHVATKLFELSKQDAAEHVLQLTGSKDRPDADTHIGSLASDCAIAFDLVPLVRVEG
ncbi:hypothetical protein [Pelagerythrobacter aerophilus]|uniref:Uncharacterized protein n=1 Tax=Pelagerythrobacter aerophilus TaxID=2306995 RepID=A0A418NL56_9SPHN|nr:hypothetical protein [Pelagerythrobacter aerophilus]RIV80354.1 hypothetical protein D2V04_03425 [Pelagerythrobacter aerophilus]